MSASAPLLTFFSPHHAQHNPPHEFMHGRLVPFFEMPARVEALRQGLAAAGLLRLVEPELRVRPADLAQVHDPAMLTYFEQLSAGVVVEVQKFFAAYHLQHEVDENVYFYESMFPRRTYGAAAPSRYFIYDSVSPIGRHSWTAILHSANLAHAGALALLAGEPRAYALCRPPGHHAGRDFAGGYCYVNNAAVAAAALRSLGRVAVIDVDYHHGNGTQDIFWHTPEVMLLSLHGDPAFEYPHYAGAASETGAGNILNLPLPAGTDE
ncbi:MAG: histone deacetylase family protein, partial [Anaerolineae bacterium]|nr:histone deacetylase family protein [Anaerolineae bacterium]